MIIALVVLVWVVMSVLSFGICLSWYKREFDYFRYEFKWWIFDLFGPVSLVATFLTIDGKYGFTLKPFTREERYQNFCATYGPDFRTREQFDKEYR